MKITHIVLTSSLLFGSSVTAGCAPNAGERQQAGTIMGALAGGLLGAQMGEGKGQMAAVGVGTPLGAVIGGEIGRSLDDRDRLLMAETTGQALEHGPSRMTREWRNPDTGHMGTVMPLNVVERDGTYCREYQQTVTVGGETQQAYGTACRQPDGSWKIVG